MKRLRRHLLTTLRWYRSPAGLFSIAVLIFAVAALMWRETTASIAALVVFAGLLVPYKFARDRADWVARLHDRDRSATTAAQQLSSNMNRVESALALSPTIDEVESLQAVHIESVDARIRKLTGLVSEHAAANASQVEKLTAEQRATSHGTNSQFQILSDEQQTFAALTTSSTRDLTASVESLRAQLIERDAKIGDLQQELARLLEEVGRLTEQVGPLIDRVDQIDKTQELAVNTRDDLDRIRGELNELESQRQRVVVVEQEVTALTAQRDRDAEQLQTATNDVSQKLSRDLDAQSTKLFRQVEGLMSLYATVEPKMPLPHLDGWAVSPEAAAYLTRVILRDKPELVVETGSGASTLVAALALAKNQHGVVVALEHDRSFADATRRELRDHGVEKYARVVDAPLLQTSVGGDDYRWYDLGKAELDGNIGLLLIDGPPGDTNHLARYPAIPLLSPWLTPSTVIVVDDASRPDEKEMLERWNGEFGLFFEQLDSNRDVVKAQLLRDPRQL